MKPTYHLFLIPYCLILILGLSYCRSHKDTSVSSSASIDYSSQSQSAEQINSTSNSLKSFELSFDSIEIFIQRTWGIPYDQTIVPIETNDSLTSQVPDLLYEVNFVKRPRPLSEIIGIRAFNASASASELTQDSLARTTDTLTTDDIHTDSQKDEAVSSSDVAVFDPPDIKAMAIFIIIAAAFVILVVCLIKKFKT